MKPTSSFSAKFFNCPIFGVNVVTKVACFAYSWLVLIQFFQSFKLVPTLVLAGIGVITLMMHRLAFAGLEGFTKGEADWPFILKIIQISVCTIGVIVVAILVSGTATL